MKTKIALVIFILFSVQSAMAFNLNDGINIMPWWMIEAAYQLASNTQNIIPKNASFSYMGLASRETRSTNCWEYYFEHTVTAASYTSPCPLLKVTTPSTGYGYVVRVSGQIMDVPYGAQGYCAKAFDVAYMVGVSGGNTTTVIEILDGTAWTVDAGTMTIGDLVWTSDGQTLKCDPNMSGAGADGNLTRFVYKVTIWGSYGAGLSGPPETPTVTGL